MSSPFFRSAPYSPPSIHSIYIAHTRCPPSLSPGTSTTQARSWPPPPSAPPSILFFLLHSLRFHPLFPFSHLRVCPPRDHQRPGPAPQSPAKQVRTCWPAGSSSALFLTLTLLIPPFSTDFPQEYRGTSALSGRLLGKPLPPSQQRVDPYQPLARGVRGEIVDPRQKHIDLSLSDTLTYASPTNHPFLAFFVHSFLSPIPVFVVAKYLAPCAQGPYRPPPPARPPPSPPAPCSGLPGAVAARGAASQGTH